MRIAPEGLRDRPAGDQPDPDAYVPTGQVCRSSRPAFVVRGQVDEQGIERREHRPERHALQQGNGQKSGGGPPGSVDDQVLATRQGEKAGAGQAHAQGNDGGDTAFVHLP